MLKPRGVQGFYLRWEGAVGPALNQEISLLTARLLADPLPGVTDLIPGYVTLYVEYDPWRVAEAGVRRWAETHLDLNAPDAPDAPRQTRRVEIPVRYDGPDLEDVARQAGLSVQEVVARHAAPLYHVYALGFTPGFPFLGEVDPAIRVPRKASPRAQVPAHAVAIANRQAGIYPLPSPGGWNLLGHALRRVYDLHREPPFLLEPGDEVRFVPAEGAVPEDLPVLELLPLDPERPRLEVVRPGLLDLVVDEGRMMAGRYGLSRSGPVDAHSARLANALVGNCPSAPLVEINLQGGHYQAVVDGVVAFAGGGMRPAVNGTPAAPFSSLALHRGDLLSFTPALEGSRGYLALAGGVESGRFWGSASVDLRGKIGRPLQVGDLLGAARPSSARPGFSFAPYRPVPRSGPRGGKQDTVILRLRAGPQASREALAALTRGLFTVKGSDRTGVRFEGPPVPGGEVLSEAVPIGAIQVTPAGAPILLLHDRGTLGGYAKPATLHPGDMGRAAQLRPGSLVRFRT